MPRAHRYLLPHHVWHITHRCHQRHFSLRSSHSSWRFAAVFGGVLAFVPMLSVSGWAAGPDAPIMVQPGMIAAGGSHTCRIESNATVTCWGDNRFGQLGVNGPERSTLPLTGDPLGSDLTY